MGGPGDCGSTGETMQKQNNVTETAKSVLLTLFHLP